jgi:putative flippase GtrA
MSIRVINFMIVGGLGFIIGTGLVYYPITLLLHHVSAVNEIYYLPALIPSSLVSITWNYYMNMRWTFKDKKSESVSYLRYLTMALSTIVFDIALLFVFVHYLGIYYLLGLVLATVCMFLLRYLIVNKWIWRTQKAV